MSIKLTLFTLSLFSYTTLLVCSKPLEQNSRLELKISRVIFNVTSSLHQANTFSPHITTSQQSKSTKTSSTSSSLSPPLTLTLHSRDSLHSTPHKDYKTRVMDRLARDKARVSSLQTQLTTNLQPLRSSPSPTHPRTYGFDSPIVSGTAQGSGEYFTRVRIGSPPRQLYLVVDTGSDVSWVQCQPCSVCYTQSDPIFDPAQSSTYSSLYCDAPKCRLLDVTECQIGRCLYEVTYGDGSYTVGEFATETLTFDGGVAVADVAVGCGHTNEGLFIGAGGLLGLGGGTLSFPSQINATSFSYCLVDRESNVGSTLEFNADVAELWSRDRELTVAAPLVRNPQLDTFYYVGLTGIRVSGEALTVPETAFEIDGDGNGGVIIDSGTAVTRLERSVYEMLRDEFRRGAAHLPVADPVAIFDTCYDLRGQESVAVPDIELEFAGGRRLRLPPKNYMIAIDSEGTFCLAFAGASSSMSIIGNLQQQGIRVGFDFVNSLVTFQPHKC